MKLRMRMLAVGLMAGSGVGQVPAAAPAAMMLHVSRSSADFVGGRELRLWGTIGGEKVELAAYFTSGIASNELFVLAPGDYAVKLDSEKKTDRGVERKYEVETTPGKWVGFQLAGLGE